MTKHDTADCIAIIGIGCRFPGAQDKDTFWNNLKEGTDVLVRYSEEELLANGVHPETLSGEDYVRCGYPIDDIEAFDAGFFGYSATEALLMDPQQRLFLQCAWTALEDGGQASAEATRTGVFASAKMSTYRDTLTDPDTTGTSAAFAALIGNDKDYIATRTSFKLGLTGPSLTVQSACSSSLAAVHLAVQSLLADECDMALAGGASITIPQRIGYTYEEGMICSPDAKCRAFDENAQGICAGNGVGVVLLKPLDDALRDRNNIYAVIRASAMNNDGRDKAGFTAPSVSGQCETIMDALSLADVSADDITYVEAHGTGTALGDPIEIQALTKAYREQTQAVSYCAIGSVKSNVGHLDTAAGVCSLIKTALALHHETIPATLHFSSPNPRIPFKTTPFFPAGQSCPWEPRNGRLLAGVSSFGVGGTNVHMILEGIADSSHNRSSISSSHEQDTAPTILPLSAKGRNELAEQCRLLAAHLKTNCPVLPAAMRTLCHGRRHFPCRTAVCGMTHEELIKELNSARLTLQESPESLSHRTPPRIGMMFTGQGSHHQGMGKALYRTSTAFKDAVDSLAAIMNPLLDVPLHDLLMETTGDLLENTRYAQPAIFAMEYALAAHWNALGITPHAVIGHSIGEYAAACTAGVMRMEDAARLICLRGKLTASLPAGHGMTAVFAEMKDMENLLSESGVDDVDIAAFNGGHIVIAGPTQSLKRVEKKVEETALSCRRLSVSHAFHSRQLAPIVPEFQKAVTSCCFSLPSLPFISCLTGQRETEALKTSQYWAEHLRKPVMFSKGIEVLKEQGCDVILEVGPHAVLTGMSRSILGNDIPILSSMRRESHPAKDVAATTAQLHTLGASLKWETLLADDAHLIPLPTYPFRKDSYWEPRSLDSRTARPLMPLERAADMNNGGNPLGLHRLPLPTPAFEAILDTQRIPSLRHHVINGRHMAPLGTLLLLMTEAWQRFACPETNVIMEEVNFAAPVTLSNDSPTSATILPEGDGTLCIMQEQDGEWRTCVTGTVASDSVLKDEMQPVSDASHPISAESFPDIVKSLGTTESGVSLWRFNDIRATETTVDATLELEDAFLNDGGGLAVHPSLIDPCIQLLGAFPSLFADDQGEPCLLLPTHVSKAWLNGPHANVLHCRIRLYADTSHHAHDTTCNILLQDPTGNPILVMNGLSMTRVPQINESIPVSESDLCLTRFDWQPASLGSKSMPDNSTHAIAIHHPHASAPIDREIMRTRCLSFIPPMQGTDSHRLDDAFSMARQSENGTELELVHIAEGGTPGDHAHFFSHLSRTSLPERLTLITIGALSTQGEAPVPSQRVAWELGAVFTAEHPHCRTTRIDLQNRADLEAVLEILADGQALPPQCAYRDGDMLCPIMIPVDSATSERDNLFAVPDGQTALITGATGGLAKTLIQRLVANGCHHLLLTARNNPDTTTLKEWQSLRQKGIGIEFKAMDISRRKALVSLLHCCGKTMPELGAVYHLAGVSSHHPLEELSPHEFETASAAKIDGATLLHSLTSPMTPKRFVVFSSMATLHGIARAGTYTAANGYMEALCQRRRAEGLPATCIAWGPFGDSGMLEKDREGHALRKSMGIHSLTAKSALARLEEWPTDCPVLYATQTDWSRFHACMTETGNAPAFQLSPSLCKTSPTTDITSSRNTERINTSSASRSKTGITAEALRDNRLEEAVGNALTALLHLSAPPDPHDNLLVGGMDSLLFLQFSQQIRKELGIRLGPAEVFTDPTLSAICRLIREKLGDTPNPRTEETVSTPQQDESFPLTDTQYAYWAGRNESLPLGGIACHSYAEYDAKEFDAQRYETAWNVLIQRHPMLRMSITPEGRQIVQEAVPPLPMKHDDFRTGSAQKREQALQGIREKLSHKVHDTSRWPLFTVRTARMTDETTRIFVSIDLLLADAHSLQIIMSEVKELYEVINKKHIQQTVTAGMASTLARQAGLSELTYSFRQYLADAEADRTTPEGQRQSEESAAYWEQRLDDLPSGPDMPLAVAPEAITAPRFRQHRASMASEQWAVLKKKATMRGLTPSLLLLGVYADIVARWSHTKRFCLNVTLFDRQPHHPQVMDIVGDFTTLNLLAVEHDPGAPAEERFTTIRDRFWQDMEHTAFSGVAVMRRLTSLGRMAFGESYPVVFTSNLSGESQGPLLNTVGTRGFNISQTPQVWLDNQVHEDTGNLVVHWDAVDALFPPHMVDDMLAAYMKELSMLAEDDKAWQRTSFPVLPQRTRDIIQKMNETTVPLPDHTLWSLFRDACRATPEATALITSSETLTYAQLAARVGIIASRLTTMAPPQRAEEDSLAPIGICLPKGPWQIAAVLGVCATGMPFVPIDHELPKSRRASILKEAAASIVLTDKDIAEWQSSLSTSPAPSVAATLPGPASSADVAYVIYTSGSTGKPKGVAISHAAAVNTILDVNRRYAISSDDIIFGVSRLTFDLSIYDIFGSFAAGATLVLPDDKGQRDPSHWLDCLNDHGCTVWNSAPALLQLAVDYAESEKRLMPSLRTVMLSGDRIPPSLPSRMRKQAPGVHIHSLGGATEAAIWSICLPITDHRPNDGPIPYGRPMDNQEWYVLDAGLHPCPEYVQGDLYIAGAGLALGYYRDDARTKEAFPVHPQTGQRLYRTGDLGSMTSDGMLTIAGRRDFQVKINGHRVEPGEVEHVLSRHPDVVTPIVMPVDTGRGKKLAAYYTGNAEETALRAHLSECLPAYMVPSRFMRLEHFPVTPSGKIDRKALPTIDMERPEGTGTARPSTPTEQRVAIIWNDLLQREETPLEMDFFAAGGDSVLAARMTLALRTAFQTDFALPRFFENPTILGLATHFATNTESHDDVPDEVTNVSSDHISGKDSVVDIIHASELASHPAGNHMKDLLPDTMPETVLSSTSMQRPFLTGATGFLGSHLLHSLLNTSIENVTCLVRADSIDEGMERIMKTGAAYGLPMEAKRHRLTVIPGDLSRQRFGLTEKTFTALADSVDAIFHAGAMVHYIYSYESLLGPNVNGTREIIRFAATGKAVRPIHHVSTVSVFSPLRSDSTLTIMEDDPIEQDMRVFGGYPQSKWLAERVLGKAFEAGIPVSIYRPGLITGNSRTGGWNREDFLYRIVRGALEAGCIPGLSRTENFLPVDVVADTVVHIATSGSSERFFHIDGFNPVSADQLIETLNACGAALRIVPYEEWRRSINAPTNALFPLLPIFPERVDPERIARQLAFDNTNTRKALQGSDIRYPTLKELLPVYAKSLLNRAA